MAELRQMAEALGYAEPRTLLQSGNLLFRAAGSSAAAVERALREGSRRALGVEIEFFVRTAAEWAALVSENPFPREAKADPGHLLAMPLSGAPGRGPITALENAIPGRERFRVIGRTAYLVYPDGVGRSRFTVALIERTLGVRATGRNWNTVLKIAAALGEG